MRRLSFNQPFSKKIIFLPKEDKFWCKIDDKRSCSLLILQLQVFFQLNPDVWDGGATFTDNDDLGHLARQISTHGQERNMNTLD